MSHQTTGLDEFQEKYFTSSPVFMDEAKEFYRALGMVSAADGWQKDETIKAAAKIAHELLSASDADYKLNFSGEGSLLGGLVVFQQGAPIFVHHEKVFGDVASPDRIKGVCGIAPSSKC